MTDPQGAVRRLRDFLDAATPWLPDSHEFCRFRDSATLNNPHGWPLLLGDISHATAQLEQIRQWAATTEHGTAAAEILALLDQPARTRSQTCEHTAEYHGPEAGCIECRCTSTTGHS